MKKNILPILFATVITAGCCADEHRTASVSAGTTSANTDNTYNSPTYDRIVAESKIYSPGSEDISSALQKSSETSQSLSARAEPIVPAPTASASVSDSDRSVEAKIRAALNEDVTLAQQVPNMQISAEGGKVMLKGPVSSEQEKQQAEAIAQKTSGVISVDNQLVVSVGATATVPSPTSSSEQSRIYSGTNASSTEINAPKAIEAAPEKSQQTSIDANAARTRSEVIGEASSATNQAAIPAQAGTSVTAPNSAPTSDRPGSRIYSTNEQGTVVGQTTATTQGKTTTESALVTQIRTAISGDTTLSVSLPNLTIAEDGGKVILRGKVKSEQEKKDLETLVQKTTGVTSVDNQLEVSTSP